jgi:predicted DNA-binding ribbon-helix-helix protein
VPPAPGSIAKRSVAIAGHRTSVSLEHAFWTELKTLADAEGCTVNELVTRIDRARQGNLSSAIRVYVLTRVKERA